MAAWTLAYPAAETAAASAALVSLHAVTGRYRPRRDLSVVDDAVPLCLRALFVLVLAGVPTGPLGPSSDPVRTAGVVLGFLAVLLLGRVALYTLVQHYRRGRSASRRTLVVGDGPVTAHVIAGVQRQRELGLTVVGRFATRDGAEEEPSSAEPSPVAGDLHDLRYAVRSRSIDTVIVVLEEVPGPQHGAVARVCSADRCETLMVLSPSGLASSVGGGAGQLAGFPYVVLRGRAGGAAARLAKRAFDVVTATTIAALIWPVLLACAVAVRVEGGPGVLFRQRRVGLGGEQFVLLKFRTLKPSDEHEADTRWSVDGDLRMGPVGRFLRRTSLDELPQLWNVVRGDMSLVGPRPERPHFVEQFSAAHPGYGLRHRAPAGLTGWAQVHGLRGDTSIELRARFDNHYIDAWTFTGDLKILMMTVRSVFTGGGR
ncbi:sugar transferase [Spirillospora sp. CA-253888]